jgi:hypothetical protein
VCFAAACGGGSSRPIAEVGSKPITQKQLAAVLAYYRSQYLKLQLTFPHPGSPEYLLLREQAIDFLVEQSRAHQADAKIGVSPQDSVVSDAAFRKVTENVHVTDAEVQRYFDQHRTKRQLDLGMATEIRQQLLARRRATVMHGFVSAVKRDYPVTYAPGYEPESEIALARKASAYRPSNKPCDLRPGMYPVPTAVEHGCDTSSGPGEVDEKPCAIVDPPHALNGFSGSEVNDGFENYATSNAGTCAGDPRGAEEQVTEAQSRPPKPVTVSYLPGKGTATYTDPLLGLTLRYPRRLRLQQVSYGSSLSVAGVAIANFRVDPATPTTHLPPRGIQLLITQGVPEGPYRPVTNASLPLRITEASLAAGVYSTAFAAGGQQFTLQVTTRANPSKRDVDALIAVAASIRFPPLRIGHFTPTGSYVLGRTADYPVGSVTEVPAGIALPHHPTQRSGRFYLEHAADGFWVITWPDDLLHGYKACGPHYDAQRREFTCPSGAVWGFKGNVVNNPDPARDQDDPLQRSQILVSGGYVIVSLPPPP